MTEQQPDDAAIGWYTVLCTFAQCVADIDDPDAQTILTHLLDYLAVRNAQEDMAAGLAFGQMVEIFAVSGGQPRHLLWFLQADMDEARQRGVLAATDPIGRGEEGVG